DHRCYQGLLIQLEVGKNLGHFQTGAITAGAVGPAVLRGTGGPIQFGGPFAGLLQQLRLGQRHVLLNALYPGVDIYSAILIDRLLCSDLHHDFLCLADTKSAMASTCAVWGNISMMPPCSNR